MSDEEEPPETVVFFQMRHAHLAAAGVKIAYRTQAVASNQQAIVVAIDTMIGSLAFEPSPRESRRVISRNVRNDKPGWAMLSVR